MGDNLPYRFELSPLFQAVLAPADRPWPDADLNGDGRTDTDRWCVGSTLANPILTPGCTMGSA